MNDDILTKFMLGEASNEEERMVNRWIIKDQNNEQYFKDFQQIWDASKNLALVNPEDEQEAWNKFKRKRDQRQNTENKTITFRPRFRLIQIAATVTLLILSGIVFYTLFENQKGASTASTIYTSNNIFVKKLSDGSIITLNKYSTLSYPEYFNGNKREINLIKGEAFFHVAPDKKKPFIINTNDLIIKVVGTSFNVKNNNSSVEVIVETGIVNVCKKETAIRLIAKEKLSIKKGDESFIKEKSKDQFHNYYRTKRLIARNTPLSRIVEVLSEAYSVQIIVESENLRNLPISTTFKLEYSIEKILDIVSETLKVKVTRTNDKILLK